jgi:hypothetical protein
MTFYKFEPTLCTIACAAQILGRSPQQVGRYLREGRLTTVVPTTAQRERTQRLLLVDEVLKLKAAQDLIMARAADE